MTDEISEGELAIIEACAAEDGRPEVFGEDAIRMVDTIRRLRDALEEALHRWAVYDEDYGHHRERIEDLRRLLGAHGERAADVPGPYASTETLGAMAVEFCEGIAARVDAANPGAPAPDLERLDAIARASWNYPWEVSRSNGTITAVQPGDHHVTVAFAANVDEEYSSIQMREEEAVYIETFPPPVVRRLIAMARRGGQ